MIEEEKKEEEDTPRFAMLMQEDDNPPTVAPAYIEEFKIVNFGMSILNQADRLAKQKALNNDELMSRIQIEVNVVEPDQDQNG